MATHCRLRELKDLREFTDTELLSFEEPQETGSERDREA